MLEQKILPRREAGRAPVRAERRLAERLGVHLEAECEAAGTACHGLVISLSAKGAALIAPQAFDRGSTFLLRMANDSGSVCHTRQARVVYLRAVSESDWILGCEFASPLADDELQELLS